MAHLRLRLRGSALMQGTYLMLVYSVVKVFEIFASHYLMAEKKEEMHGYIFENCKKTSKEAH